MSTTGNLNKAAKKRIAEKHNAISYKLKQSKIYPEIHQKLIEGREVIDIINTSIRNSKNDFTHYSDVTLKKVIEKIKNSIPKAEFLEKTSPSIIKDLQKKIPKQMDVLLELNTLYNIQMKRVLRAVEQEDLLNMNMEGLDLSLKTAKDIIKEVHAVHTDLGLSPKHLGTLDVNAQVLQGVVHKFASNNDTKSLENPVSRHKVLTVAQRILAIAASSSNSNEANDNLNLISNLLNNNNNDNLDSKIKALASADQVIIDQEVEENVS